MRSSPHDAIFKASFGQPDIARGELDLVLPPDVRAQLDLSTLTVCPGSFVDEDLQHTHSDLLYSVRTIDGGGEGFVYVLFEHQSSPDAAMPFRLLRYLVRIWERWIRDHPGGKLPIVLPVLLHHGDGAWRGAPELAAMLDAGPALLAAARPFVPHFRFVLDDLAALSPAALSSRPVGAITRLVQLAMWASRSFPRLRDAAPFMRSVAATLARDERTRVLLTQLFLYALRTAPPDVDVRAIRTILFDVAGPEGREEVMNAADQLREEGREEGRAAMRSAIAQVFGARGVPLSELGRARLASCADTALLTLWLARAATAASEGEVFASAG